MKNLIEKDSKKKQKGASLVEYGLLVSLIAVVAVVAVRTLGTTVSTTFSEADSAL